MNHEEGSGCGWKLNFIIHHLVADRKQQPIERQQQQHTESAMSESSHTAGTWNLTRIIPSLLFLWRDFMNVT
jgi:hypothetical protein